MLVSAVPYEADGREMIGTLVMPNGSDPRAPKNHAAKQISAAIETNKYLRIRLIG